jgi:arylformamidase
MTLVYRYYDQAELERQLNARATVPDITPILAQYASESERMRSRLPCCQTRKSARECGS